QVHNIEADIEVLHNGLSTVLQKTASNEAITKLQENRELESWIRAGLSHHIDSDVCEFCGSIIPQERLWTLQQHFSKAYEDLTSEVSSQITTLEETKLATALPDERDFIPDLRAQFTFQ